MNLLAMLKPLRLAHDRRVINPAMTRQEMVPRTEADAELLLEGEASAGPQLGVDPPPRRLLTQPAEDDLLPRGREFWGMARDGSGA